MKVHSAVSSFLYAAMTLLGVVMPTYAQKFTIGVKAGGTLSISAFRNPDDRDTFTNLWKPGFFGAALINFPMKKNYSIQSEFGYAQRGRKVEFNNGTWQNNADYSFLDGALLLRKSYPLNWTSTLRGTWYFNVGPHISYWLGGTGTVTSDSTFTYRITFGHPPEEPAEPDFNTMYLRDVNRWLVGLDLGVGVDVPTRGTQQLGLEIRFTSEYLKYGSQTSAFNPTAGFSDNLRAHELFITLAGSYTLTHDLRKAKKGKSTKKESRKSKPRKNIDSMIH